MIANLSNNITVTFNLTNVKVDVDNSLTDIAVIFYIYRDGAQVLRPVSFSLRKRVKREEWDMTCKELKGNSREVKSINTDFTTKLNAMRISMEQTLRDEKLSCLQVADYIKTTLRTSITGVAPRGFKEVLQNEQDLKSIANVMERHLQAGNQSKERQRNYRHAINYIYQYCKAKGMEAPLITQVDEDFLQDFKDWYIQSTTNAIESSITYFSMIRAVFRFAAKRKNNIIPFAPIPDKFVPIKENETERYVLPRMDRNALVNIEDSNLSTPQQVAKYCAILQLRTGIGYGDLRTLTDEHIHYNPDKKKFYIQKPRQKTKIVFRVYLTKQAEQAIKKLRELAGGNGTAYCFQLPKLDSMNRRYKQLATIAAIGAFTSYTLRHTFAVNFIERGGTLQHLKKILGHKKLSTTEIYGRVSDESEFERMMEVERRSEQGTLRVA